VASWWANQMGVYGGRNIMIASNLFLDSVKKTGIELNAGFGALPPIGQTAINNTLIRCGSYGYAINQPGIIVEGGGTNTIVANNIISNAMFEGVEIQSTWNLLIQTNLITAPGTTGITIDSGYSGSGNIRYNTVTNLNAGQSAYINNAPGTFTVILASNSWQLAASSLLSQGEQVTADSSQTGSGNVAANGNDGSLGTRWAANDNLYPQWWRVDLGTNCNLSSVTIDWYGTGGRSYQYKIEVSTNDINYITTVDKTSNTSTANTTDTFTAAARYVRITITGVVPTGGNASFYECLVYGSVVPSISLTPTNIAITAIGGAINLSWPPDHLGWHLQIQTNTLGTGLGTNWVTLPGSDSITGTNITINPASGAVFYRLASP
jgi:hypothetical protein